MEEGESARFECQVEAKPPVTSVKWWMNERFVALDFKYTIPHVKKGNAGTYTCSADNGLGKSGETDVNLEVLYAPEVSLPESKEVSEGEDVYINCQVNANPQPNSIQWFKMGNDRFIQSGPTLRLTRVKAEDNGKYVCSASNIIEPTGQQKMVRTANATIDINVHHKPGRAFVTPNNPIGVDGKRIILTCSADPPGFPEPDYKWFKGGSEATMAIAKEFIIDPVRLSNAGTYHCQASNKYGSGKIATTDLRVYQAPKIEAYLPNSIQKREGDSGFYLTCSAVGKPKPEAKWFKDGQEIDNESSTVYQITTAVTEKTTNGGYKVQSTLKFSGEDRIKPRFNNLMPQDRGHYTCQFTNEVASADTTMLMKIEHSPQFMHKHNKVAYDIGQTGYINCLMQSYPKPIVDWSFNRNPVRDDKIFHETNVTQLGEDMFQAVLKINKVLDTSYGDYVCKGTNKMGSKMTIVKLQPRGKPESPTHLRAVDIGYNYISIGFEEGFNGGYSNTEYVVQYQMQQTVGGRRSTFHYVDPCTNPCNITNLEQHSVYDVQVKARNDRGESKWSEGIAVMSRVDVNRIPKPSQVQYENSTRSVSFAMKSTPLDLIAKIQLENKQDGTWRHYDAIAVKDTDFAEMKIDAFVSNLRVRLCLASNEELCGPYAEAVVVKVRPNAGASAASLALRKPWVIGLIVVIVLLALLAVLLIIRCCCCKKPKTLKTPEGPGSTNGVKPPPYTTYGIENKGVETVKDHSGTAPSTEAEMKASLYGQSAAYTATYGVYPSEGGSGGVGGGANSNSNSANGGSVNSQDSLWNVKKDAPDYSQQLAAAAGYGPASHHHHFEHQQQFMQAYGTPAMVAEAAGDYSHYPYPDEYLNDRNRQYLVNNAAVDTYSHVNKQQHRPHRLDSSDCKLLFPTVKSFIFKSIRTNEWQC